MRTHYILCLLLALAGCSSPKLKYPIDILVDGHRRAEIFCQGAGDHIIISSDYHEYDRTRPLILTNGIITFAVVKNSLVAIGWQENNLEHSGQLDVRYSRVRLSNVLDKHWWISLAEMDSRFVIVYFDEIEQ